MWVHTVKKILNLPFDIIITEEVFIYIYINNLIWAKYLYIKFNNFEFHTNTTKKNWMRLRFEPQNTKEDMVKSIECYELG